MGFDVEVAPRQTRYVGLTYVNDLNLDKAPIARTNVRANILRRLSDFRDITLSKSDAGQELSPSIPSIASNVLESHLERPVVLILIVAIGLWGAESLYRKSSQRSLLARYRRRLAERWRSDS